MNEQTTFRVAFFIAGGQSQEVKLIWVFETIRPDLSLRAEVLWRNSRGFFFDVLRQMVDRIGRFSPAFSGMRERYKRRETLAEQR